MTEKTLSDNIQYNLSNRGTIYAEKVKEFIQKLKEESQVDWDKDDFVELIDKLAGAELTK